MSKETCLNIGPFDFWNVFNKDIFHDGMIQCPLNS